MRTSTQKKSVKLREGAKVLQWQRILVCILCLVLVVVFAIGYYISDQRTRATGLAQDLYYATTTYLMDCGVNGKKVKYDGGDAEHYYITNPDTLKDQMSQPIDGEFTALITKAKGEVVGVECVKKTVIAGYVLESTGVFPSGSGSSGARWYRQVDVQIMPEEPIN